MSDVLGAQGLGQDPNGDSQCVSLLSYIAGESVTAEGVGEGDDASQCISLLSFITSADSGISAQGLGKGDDASQCISLLSYIVGAEATK